MKAIDWTKCYGESWSNEITPDTFAHPAKFSRALIRRIYAHMLESGYLHEGDCVLDPFGGVALGALEAMVNGCNWVSVELEQKFVDLGNQNIALWNKRYAGKLRKWGSAILLQGDSRDLLAVLKRSGFDSTVSSPPFTGITATQDPNFLTTGEQRKIIPSKSNLAAYSTNPRNLGNLKGGSVDAVISSPPFMEAQSGGGIAKQLKDSTPGRRNQGYQNQGNTPGQLGAMKAGQFDAAVSSPLYSESATGAGGLNSKPPKKKGQQSGRAKGPSQSADAHYGESKGQLSRLADSVVSSPPFEDSTLSHDTKFMEKIERDRRSGSRMQGGGDGYYGQSENQLGNVRGETFWSAARQIVGQTYLALKPGAYAAFVVKAFVRNKKIVDFPGQWQILCEACGFETIEYIRAWLVEDRGTAIDLDGKHKKKITERKSFFRRLAEKKGSPGIDYEVVLIMHKV